MFQKERNYEQILQLHQKEVVERDFLRLVQNMITKKIVIADILQNEILSKERAAEDHDRQTEGPRHLTGQKRQVSKSHLSSFLLGNYTPCYAVLPIVGAFRSHSRNLSHLSIP